MHDCTGPLTLYAGLQVATAVSNVVFQESVRAHIHTLYPQLIEGNVKIRSGYAEIPQGNGLGVRLQADLFKVKGDRHRISTLGAGRKPL